MSAHPCWTWALVSWKLSHVSEKTLATTLDSANKKLSPFLFFLPSTKAGEPAGLFFFPPGTAGARDPGDPGAEAEKSEAEAQGEAARAQARARARALAERNVPRKKRGWVWVKIGRREGGPHFFSVFSSFFLRRVTQFGVASENKTHKPLSLKADVLENVDVQPEKKQRTCKKKTRFFGLAW